MAPESFYNPMLADVCAELEASGVAVISDGALCAFPPGFTGRDGKPLPLMLRKSDGGYGYATTDLATIRYRLRDLHVDRTIYVVGVGPGAALPDGVRGRASGRLAARRRAVRARQDRQRDRARTGSSCAPGPGTTIKLND